MVDLKGKDITVADALRVHPGPRKGLSPPPSQVVAATFTLPARGPQAQAWRLYE